MRMNVQPKEDSDSDATFTDHDNPTLADIISEKEVNMAVHPTEWFQEQRRVYEQVNQ